MYLLESRVFAYKNQVLLEISRHFWQKGFKSSCYFGLDEMLMESAAMASCMKSICPWKVLLAAGRSAAESPKGMSETLCSGILAAAATQSNVPGCCSDGQSKHSRASHCWEMSREPRRQNRRFGFTLWSTEQQLSWKCSSQGGLP